VKSSVSIALFFLLSGFFLAVLLGAVERSRKLLAVAAGFLAAIVCIIVFLSPVDWPEWKLGLGDGHGSEATGVTTSSTLGGTSGFTGGTTSTPSGMTVTTIDTAATTEAAGALSR
jgi:hypothetical protein